MFDDNDDISNEPSMGYKAEELLRAALKLTDPGTVKTYIFLDPELYEILAVGIDALAGAGEMLKGGGRKMHGCSVCVRERVIE